MLSVFFFVFSLPQLKLPLFFLFPQDAAADFFLLLTLLLPQL